MQADYIVVVLAWGDGEAYSGSTVTSIRCRTKEAAKQIAEILSNKDYIRDAFVVND